MYDKAVKRSNNRWGLIQVYTGNGKGKTTAALGQAFRALGYKKRVLLIQFMKKAKACGEIKAARGLPNFKILQAGARAWVRKGKPTLADKRIAQKGLSLVQKAIAQQKYDLIILDELNVAVEYGLLKVQQIKELLRNKPETLELVITGRHAHPEILKLADLISEVKEVKHYYRKGITARAGIEY